ncbi:aldehyde dehydrogenase family 16 member A1 [Thalassophryne amazonica]|uniref:aldehyde dehydrogenase family 16 member A1 n=1 Tax=Thalassophryne amazonica TaxID=390379 RepID=UPI001470EE4F|nr:aldehyde dehydrogenase family 16 member A1 [Thalassophryne amazonica]
MAGSSATTVYDIFQSMEYGPTSTSNTSTAQAWLHHHSCSLGFFIDGKFVRPADRQTHSLTNSKGEEVCRVLCAVEDDISECATSAVNGYRTWSGLSCSQRSKVMLRLVSVLGQHCQCLAQLCELCESPCTPSSLVRLLQYYSSWAYLRDTHISSWTPLGVVAVVVSDDSSLYSLVVKVFPALAMGNSVIIVPGWSTAPPALLLAELFVEAGLPAGVLNVIIGGDMSLGAKVIQNTSISSVAYSGNKQDGVMLCKATAGMGVSVAVSPYISATCVFIVFESADIDSAVDATIEAAFKKNKEVNWVLYVQESVLDSVVARLKLRVARIKCVPMRTDGDRELVDAVVQEAQQQGAMLIQSCADPTLGTQYPPTVLCGVASSSPCVVTPSPGPLLPLMTFRSNTEAVTLANHTPHGQAASIWTEDLTLALEMAKSLEVGSVWVNSHSIADPCLPVSGHKDSGTCTDGGQEGLYQFLRPSISCWSPLPRSFPASVDYTKFGVAVPSTIIPKGSHPSSVPKSYLQFIAGKPCKSESGCSMAVQSPGGAGVLAYCPEGGRKDIRNAVEAAVKVQPGWMKKSPSARAQSLYSLAKGLEAKRQDMATSLNLQTGLSLEEAEKEVEHSIARLTDWAAYCDKIHGGSLSLPQSGSALSLPEALGVVGIVLPDKKPILSMVTLLGAAIAAGNAVVMAPSQKCPVPALTFIQVLQSSDLPAGLVNIITGSRDQLTVALATHNVIKAIWYWGSAEGCQYLQYTCTNPLKTLWLFCQNDDEGEDGEQDWTHPNPLFLEHVWRNAIQWKSVWIPTA